MAQVWTTDRSAPAGSAARLRRWQALAGAVLALAVLLQPPAATFVYDATKYWAGAQALLGGGSAFDAGALDVRGVLTPFLYLPAAAVVAVGGDSLAGFAVLVQNAVLIAGIGSVLVPRVAGLWRPVTPRTVGFSAVGTGTTLAGFAPFPLTDLWAAALLVAVVVLVEGRTRWWLLGAGAAAGAAVNIRPASLLGVAAVAVAVLVARRTSALWFLLGAAVALAPQFLLNRWRGTTWLPWPEGTGGLTGLQASYASYVVRYDTVVAGPATDPRLFFCSPGMAQALDGRTPSSPGELAVAFLAHLPEALVFSAQKVGAALHWPLSTPYSAPAAGSNALFALLVTAVTVTGAAVLARRTLRRSPRPTAGQVAAVLVWAASVTTLVTSAAEARFALPLVLLGVAGCALWAAEGRSAPRDRRGRAWVAGTVVAVLAVYGVGVTGMRHPLEGPATVTACAQR